MDDLPIFKYLQDASHNPIEIAKIFVRENLSDENINKSLTLFLLNSCGIETAVPEDMIKNQAYDDLLNFFEEKFSQNKNAVPLNTAKYYDRFLAFFEYIISEKWSHLTNDGRFDNYLPKLIDALSFSEYTIVHVSSFAIKLKFVTGYLKSANGRPITNDIRNYVKELLKRSIHYMAIQCPISALNELLIWINLDDEFAKDEYLPVITWSLKMEKPKLVCTALKVSRSLLSMRHFHARFFLFARKLSEIFEDLCYTENTNIFDWICRCCELIYVRYREALLAPFVDNLLENLFAFDRSRAKAVARFWINTAFMESSIIHNTRTIIKFLSTRKPLHARVFVDSLIEDYKPMTNWKLYVEMLTDEKQLNGEEKLHLLTLMWYAVERIIQGPPEFRSGQTKQISLEIRREFATEVTKTLVPHFETISKLDYPKKLYARTVLLKVVIYFNFSILERNQLLSIMNECIFLYEHANHTSTMQVALKVLQSINKRATDKSMANACVKVLRDLRDDGQSEFEKLIADFIKSSDRYADPTNKDLWKTASVSLLRMYVLNSSIVCEEKYAFDIPWLILRHQLLTDCPFFLYMLHICILIACEYVSYTLALLKNDQDDCLSSEKEGIISNLCSTVKVLSLGLKDWYASELSVVAFCGLTRILKEAKSLEFDGKTWDEVCPLIVKRLITAYVSLVVWKADEQEEKEWPIRTKIHVLKEHLNLIIFQVLPNTHAYVVMKNISQQREIIEGLLRGFIEVFCKRNEPSAVATWLLKWLQTLHSISPSDCLAELSDFIGVINPIRKELQEVLYQFHMIGIDYALSPDSAGNSKSKFLDVLAELCVCLEQDKKKAIHNYFKEKRSNVDAKILKHYTKCLTSQAKFKPIASTPMASSTPTGNEEYSSVLNSSFSPANVRGSGSDEEFVGLSSVLNSNSAHADVSDSETDSSRGRVSSRFVLNTSTESSTKSLAQMLRENKFDYDQVDDVIKGIYTLGCSSPDYSINSSPPRKRRLLDNFDPDV